jgi:hypothetical protein
MVRISPEWCSTARPQPPITRHRRRHVSNSAPLLEAFGHGYGFDLFSLAPPEVRGGQEKWEVRTPHSVFYYPLGYTGWVGVVLFAALQLTILRLLWQSFGSMDSRPGWPSG